MYAKPHVIEVSILHILIPDKRWMGNIYCEVWTSFKSLFGRSDKILGFWGFISPFCTLKTHTFDLIPLANPKYSLSIYIFYFTYLCSLVSHLDSLDRLTYLACCDLACLIFISKLRCEYTLYIPSLLY